MNEFIILFRETLEAALIVGIVYTFLDKLAAVKAKQYLWFGVVSAIVGSIALGAVLIWVQSQFQSKAYENLFEGIMMFLAAGFLLYMVVWMAKNTGIAGKLKQNAQQALNTNLWGIFFLVFFAIIREGFESVIFLHAIDTMKDGEGVSWLGALAGILIASALGFLIFAQGRKVPLRHFFNYTSIFLILLAAGMVAYGTHEIEEFLVKQDALHVVGIQDTQDANGQITVPAKDKIIRPWDILQPIDASETNGQNIGSAWILNEEKGRYYHLFHDNGLIGQYLKMFIGYNSNPNWVEVLLWLITALYGFWAWNRAKVAVGK
jgi:high-affinity iron transporter